MSYKDKYKGNYAVNGRRSVYDILSLDPKTDWDVIEQNYVAKRIDKVKIGGNTFTNYGDFQFTWEKSYAKSPERSQDGSINNLNAHPTFVTPHLIINFSVMSIDDYRKIARLDLEQNEFIVECYDPIYNNIFVGKMYFGTPQMAKLVKIAKTRFNEDAWEEFVELVGVQEYSVELIGTNAELDTISVIYHLNPPSGTGKADFTISTDDMYSGADIIIGENTSSIKDETFSGTYQFTKWNVSPENPTIHKETGNYLDGYAYTINSGEETVDYGKTAFHLYAQWQATSDKTLSFSYGDAYDATLAANPNLETSRSVQYGQPIGALPSFSLPTVSARDINGELKEYNPYYDGAWYKTHIVAENSVPVYAETPYWMTRNSSLFLVLTSFKYNLRLEIVGEESLFRGGAVGYGAPLDLPTPTKNGMRFDGWYTSTTFESDKKYTGTTMPPYDLTLYGRWIV